MASHLYVRPSPVFVLWIVVDRYCFTFERAEGYSWYFMSCQLNAFKFPTI